MSNLADKRPHLVPVVFIQHQERAGSCTQRTAILSEHTNVFETATTNEVQSDHVHENRELNELSPTGASSELARATPGPPRWSTQYYVVLPVRTPTGRQETMHMLASHLAFEFPALNPVRTGRLVKPADGDGSSSSSHHCSRLSHGSVFRCHSTGRSSETGP